MSNLSKFKMIEDAVRIGGKGSMRRKHKRVPASAPHEARRLQATLSKLSLFQMTGIEQLTLSMDDQSELVIRTPQVQGSTGSNLLVVSGTPTYVAAPPAKKIEPEPGKVPSPSPSPCPSPPPPPPPPPPSPAFTQKKPAKKLKKPRNRIRLRNKRVREMLLAGAAGDGDEDSDLGSADDLLFSPRCLKSGGGDDSDDSDKTTVPSDGSDMDQTIVGDDFLSGIDVSVAKDSDGMETGSEEEAQELEELESGLNGEDKDQDDDNDYDEDEDENDNDNDNDNDNEDLQMTLDDVMSCLEIA